VNFKRVIEKISLSSFFYVRAKGKKDYYGKKSFFTEGKKVIRKGGQ